MAYIKCERCGLTAFSTAYWSSTEHCGRCGAQLPRPRPVIEQIAQDRAVRVAERPRPAAAKPTDLAPPAQ
jgi:DNA-directed RNA polymerase subunit RPC12/RpoP